MENEEITKNEIITKSAEDAFEIRDKLEIEQACQKAFQIVKRIPGAKAKAVLSIEVKNVSNEYNTNKYEYKTKVKITPPEITQKGSVIVNDIGQLECFIPF
jgi:hypothetical protein